MYPLKQHKTTIHHSNSILQADSNAEKFQIYKIQSTLTFPTEKYWKKSKFTEFDPPTKQILKIS